MESTNKTVARDVFLYFLMIFVLASSAGALGNILFNLIDQYVPGAAAVSYYGGYVGDSLKFPVATLVIMFPVLVWVVRFLKRDMATNPEKRDLKIRKWLLYLTLFVAGLTMLGDLIALVMGLLDGNTALRFILEVLVVFWLAGSIFFYFLKDLHNESPRGRMVIEWVSVVVVLASLVASLMLIGSPASQRARAHDNQRVGDLQSIESQVISYWQAKDRLPSSLADLPSGAISGFIVPMDPVSGQLYEYSTTGPLGYRLCAVFEVATPSADAVVSPRAPESMYGGVGNWQHGLGRQCFEGSIDPERLRVFVPKPI